MNEFARFALDLTRAAAGIETLAEAAEKRAAVNAAEFARSIAPVDSGEMRSKIKAKKRPAGGWVVESPDVAAVFQEFGTSVMAPNPSIRPSIDRFGPELVRDVEGIRDEVVRRLGG